MFKIKGLKILFEPVGNENLPGNRYTKNVSVGSFTNGSLAEAVAGPPPLLSLQ